MCDSIPSLFFLLLHNCCVCGRSVTIIEFICFYIYHTLYGKRFVVTWPWHWHVVLSQNVGKKVGSTHLSRITLHAAALQFILTVNMFQHDNCPVHKTSSMKTWFAKVGVKELQSDLNTILASTPWTSLGWTETMTALRASLLPVIAVPDLNLVKSVGTKWVIWMQPIVIQSTFIILLPYNLVSYNKTFLSCFLQDEHHLQGTNTYWVSPMLCPLNSPDCNPI